MVVARMASARRGKGPGPRWIRDPVDVDGVSWHPVTAPDEQQRCCVVIDGNRCSQASRFRVASSDGALDDYTYVCADHLALVAGPGKVATRLDPA